MAGVPKLVLIGDTLFTLYENMVRMRCFAEGLGDLVEAGHSEALRPRIGHEAVAAGVSFHLSPDDLVFAARPALAVAIGKGVESRALAAQWLRRAGGCGGGIGGAHAFAAPEQGLLAVTTDSAAPLLNAAGAAAAKQSDKDNQSPLATLAFFGADGLVDGAFYEAVRCAGHWELPTIFVGQIDRERRLDSKRWTTVARTNGLAAVHADGRQISEVYAAAHEAVRRAREGEGPSLLLFDTAFSGAGQELRDEDDPIQIMRQQLLEDSSISSDELDALHDHCEAEIEAAVQAALQSPPVNWKAAQRLMLERNNLSRR